MGELSHANTKTRGTQEPVTEKILTKGDHIRFRKPSKISGKLISGLIETCSRIPEIAHLHLCELNCELSCEGAVDSAQENYNPLIAVTTSAPSNSVQSERILAKICACIEGCSELERPIDVCLVEQLPEVKNAIAAGLAREFYTRR